MRCAAPRGRSNSSKWSRPRKPRSASKAISTSRRAASRKSALADALGRVLAADIAAPVDVPPFDRSGVDGFALRAADTSGASDTAPRRLLAQSRGHRLRACAAITVASGTATAIATGGVLPRGADAVVMIEHTELLDDPKSPAVEIRRAAAPGQFIAYAGSDIARGETLLRKGTLIGSREIGMLAACGIAAVEVIRKPRVAVLSTGDELMQPGETLRPAAIYDSNGAIVAAAVTEAGGEPVRLWRLPGRRSDARSGDAQGACRMRHAGAVGRHLEGRRRPLARHRPEARPARHSGAWRSAEARQAALPCGRRSTSRSWCCRAFRPRRSSPSTPSSRR